MAKKQDQSSDVPFLGNDMKDENEAATTGKDLNPSDGPGKADSEMGEGLEPDEALEANLPPNEVDRDTAEDDDDSEEKSLNNGLEEDKSGVAARGRL